MEEYEIKAELEIINTAIRNIMLLGQSYEIGTGSSKRIFNATDIDKLRNYRNQLNKDLRSITGQSGLNVGY